MSITYFGLDGNYGDAVGLVIVDTTKFTADDFDAIDMAADSMRPYVALKIAKEYEHGL